MSQIHHTRVVSKRKMNDKIDDHDDKYKLFQRQQEILNIQMFKMQEKEVDDNVSNISNISNVSNVVETKNVETLVVQSPSDEHALSAIRDELESYKKQTDGRIEKLVNLFLSIDK